MRDSAKPGVLFIGCVVLALYINQPVAALIFLVLAGVSFLATYLT